MHVLNAFILLSIFNPLAEYAAFLACVTVPLEPLECVLLMLQVPQVALCVSMAVFASKF